MNVVLYRREDDHPGSSRVCWSSGQRGTYREGMRHPALHLAGIVASPGGGGGGIFGTGAEEELRKWLEVRLDALGIDPVAYSRFVLSLLRRPDSVFSPCGKPGAFAKSGCRQSRISTKAPPTTDREQKRAVIQCLASAADQVSRFIVSAEEWNGFWKIDVFTIFRSAAWSLWWMSSARS